MTTIQPCAQRRFLAAAILSAFVCVSVSTAQLRVVAPNGGERLRVGSLATIRWQGVAASDTVSLEYSTNAGATWNTITSQATGLQHVWNRVPNTPSTQCLLRAVKAASVGDSVLYLRSTRAGFVLPDAVHFAEFSPDGSRVIGGGAEGDVFIWDSFTGALLRTIPVENRANIPSPPATPGITLISCVRYSPNGALFATISPLPDSTGAMVRIFDAATGTKLREWRDVGPARIPSSEQCGFSPDGTKLVVTTLAGSGVYDVATGTLLARMKGYTSPTVISSVVSCDWSLNNAYIVGASTSGSSGIPDIVISDPVTGDTIHTFSYPNSGNFASVRISPDAARLITASTNGAARVCDAVTGAILYDIHDYVLYPTWGEFSHNGAFFATAGQDVGPLNWKLRLYDAASGAFVRLVGAIGNGMRMLQFSPDDSRILVACIDGVRIFHAPSATPGQSDVSDSLWTIYADSNAAITVGAPLITAKQGELVGIPISISDAGAALGAGATAVTVTLGYNATLLEPVGSTPSGTLNGNQRSIVLTLPLAAVADTVLAVLPFRAALGNDSTTVLDLSNATTDAATVSVSELDGLFRLSDLCREGGARLLNPNGIAALKVLGPRVITAYADVEVETIESGGTSIVLYDAAGREARRFLEQELPTGRHVMRLDFAGVDCGRYFLVFSTPTVRTVVPMEVAR